MMYKIKINTALYFIAFSLYVFINLLATTRLSVDYSDGFYLLMSSSLYLTIFLLVAKLLLDYKMSVQLLFSFLISIPIILFVGVKSSNLILLFTLLLFIFSIKDINLEKLVRVHFFLSITVLVITQVLLSIDAISDISVRTINGVYYYMGYRYLSYPPNIFFHAICSYVFLKKNKINFWDLLWITLVNYYYFVKTGVDSAFYFTLLILVISYIFKVSKIEYQKDLKLLTVLEKTLIPFELAIVYFLSKNFSYANSKLVALDSFLSNRIRLGNDALNLYGISTFGNEVTWNTQDVFGRYYGKYLFVDSSFLNILITYGIVFTLILIVAFYFLPNKNPYRSIYYQLAFIIIVLHSMWDPQFLNIWYNPFLTFLGVLIVDYKQTSMKVRNI
ncbi:hypothetical protein [Streptococcus hyovaginalis]